MNIKGAVLILAALFAAASAQAAEKFGTDVHTARGMTFEMCHGKGNPAELDRRQDEECEAAESACVAALSGSTGVHELPSHARRKRKLLRSVLRLQVQGAVKQPDGSITHR